MEYIAGTTEFQINEPTAISLGKFDGLHIGHQTLLERILQKQADGLAAVVFTFDFGKQIPGLMLNEERRQMLEKLKVDYLLECPFVPEVAHIEPEDFIRDILVKKLHMKYLAVGSDFRFGHHRRGDHRLLQQMASECGYDVEVVEKAQYLGRDISSTYIREELEKGNMELVNQLLGYNFSVTGEVLHGRKLGRTMGLPTTNLIPDAQKLLPPNGVYATKTLVGGEKYEGITNIGYKPTVGAEAQRGVETYLFDIDIDLYGEIITVEFYGYERPEQTFPSLQELKTQIESDVLWGKEYFEHY